MARRAGALLDSLTDPLLDSVHGAPGDAVAGSEPVGLGEVRAVERAFASLLSALDARSVPLPDAVAMFSRLDRIERLAQAGKALLAGRVEESRVWERAGHRDPAQHLAKLTGTSTGTARATLQTARNVAGLAATERALRRGELSREQAAAIADAAAANPDAERALLRRAPVLALKELQDECRRVKAAADPDPDATHARLRAERRASTWSDAQGAWNLAARGTADEGARIQTVLDELIDERFRAARRDGEHEAREAYAFDALVRMADLARAARRGIAPATADPAIEEETGGEASATPPRRASRRTDPRYLALLRLDLPALVRGHPEEGELCEITGVGPVPVSVARTLLGESILKLVLTKGRDVATTVHLGRGANAAQQVALLWSCPHCSNVACPRTLTEVDHRVPYEQCRQTELANLDPLCRVDHWLKTHRRWALVAGTGRRAFVPPDDPRHPDNAGPAPP
jgi:hypothetical protein